MSENIKKVLVIRLGAIGDMIIMSPVLKALKEDGYEITLNLKKYSFPAVRHNPNIDAFIFHDEEIKPENLEAHWLKLAEGFDLCVNLSGSIEGSLLLKEGTPEFDWPHEKRHKECNINYYDRMFMIPSMPQRGKVGELYFSKEETNWARHFRKKHENKFLIVWSLAGSSFHKAYPYAEEVAVEFLDKHEDAYIVTVGGSFEQILAFQHERAYDRSGKWEMWRTLILTKYANLVVAPETGTLNAAGCFKTPKIAMLSHSSEENLTKYFENCDNIHGEADCYPCHRLIYTRTACPISPDSRVSICMSRISKNKLLSLMEGWYEKWEKKQLI
jgi:ADP-heptose:LPS heptosyltransferase